MSKREKYAFNSSLRYAVIFLRYPVSHPHQRQPLSTWKNIEMGAFYTCILNNNN